MIILLRLLLLVFLGLVQCAWQPNSRKRSSLFDDFQDPSSRPEHDDVTKFTVNLNKRNYRIFDLKYLDDDSVKCNDGSKAGYYYRPAKNANAKNWLIFLEGGWYCFDFKTCFSRRLNQQALFSSHGWDRQRHRGILSWEESVNPNYHSYHNVYIPYCSSDLWTGRKLGPTEDYYFHGSRIISLVVQELLNNSSLKNVERLVFAGSSAGGIGVLMNIDRLASRLTQTLRRPIYVSGLVDSAWFLNRPAYKQTNCTSIYDCPPEEVIHRGIRLWSPLIPKRCRRAQGPELQWRCYLGPVIKPHLRTPIFIIQSLFDEAQLQLSKAPLLAGGSPDKLKYIQKVGSLVANSLRDEPSTFRRRIPWTGLEQAPHYNRPEVSEQEINSTMLFFTKLIAVLNQPHQQPPSLRDYYDRHLIRRARTAQQPSEEKESIVFDESDDSFDEIEEHMRRRRQLRRLPRHLRRHWPRFAQPRRHISLARNSHLTVIDSCTLESESGRERRSSLWDRNAHVNCENKVPLMPLCNPTCLSVLHPRSMYRIKLVDLLELFKVETEQIARNIGVSLGRLKNLSNRQQIENIFCAKSGYFTSEQLRALLPF